MVKPLLVLALLANIFYLVSSTGTAHASSHSSASSSSGGGSSSASAIAVASTGPAHASSQSSASSSSGGSSSSASAIAVASTGSVKRPPPSRHHPAPPPPSKDCDPPPKHKCRLNEIWANCPIAVCVPKTCKEVGFPVACPDLKPNCTCPVPPGCICKQGYVRNSFGKCVPMSHCPTCGGDPNAESGCGTNCNRLCSNYFKKPGLCVLGCPENGCECRLGYVFDEIRRICVFPSDCTSMICTKPNEVYDPCPPPCPAQSCDVNPALVLCAVPPQPGDPDCQPGCRCIDNYVRNHAGVCIPRDQCPTCPPNEVFDPCIAPCPPRKCDVDDRLIRCAAPPELGDPSCVAGCRCADKYYRNSNGVCVTREQCYCCDGPNEYYACGGECDNECATLHKQNQTNCPYVNIRCTDKCYCIEGHARDAYNTCIPIEHCKPICDGPHEHYACGSACDNECAFLHKQNQTNCPIVNVRCNDRCYCDKGYARDAYNICIPIEHCKPICDGPHEHYECGGACDNVCATLHKQNQTNCPIVNVRCNDDCYCDEGYARDAYNICIPIEHCKPICDGPHEHYECGGACDNVCATLHKQNQTNCPIVNVRCNDDCYCDEGYARDAYNICIPIEHCKPICDGPHEHYECGGACDNVCATLHKQNQTNCPIVNVRCNDDCYCDEGYARDAYNICIPIENCKPICYGPHEHYACGSACDNVCATLHLQDQNNCPIVNIRCNDKCYCDEGYARDAYNTCIPIHKCKPPVCNAHEVYSDCINGGCTMKNCSQIGLPVPCVKLDPKYCIKGCLCEKGYLRDDNGICVPEEECKPVCCAKNEVYEDCSNPRCRPEKCSEVGFGLNCTDPIKCKKGCKCIDDYVRRDDGVCIPIKECPSCRGDKNAQSGCGVNCLKKCYDLQNPDNPRGCEKICKVNDCDCKEGFYLNETTKTCVPPEECFPKCHKHERFEMCPAALCRPMTCDQLGESLDCPTIKEGTCPVPPGCVCIEDYVRNEKGKCIHKKDCPKCGGDPNAVSGCGINCNKHCKDIGCEPMFCILLCKENSCDCREDLYYDDNINKCVPANCCTPTCSENEVYDPCINGGCGPRYCSEIDGPILCIDPIKCKGGCTCRKGYLRVDETGECVPKNDCPGRVNITTALEKLQKGIVALNFDFLCELVEKRPGENFMFSVFSLLIVLAYPTLFACGPSEKQLLSLQNLNKDEIQVVYPFILHNMTRDQEVVFKVANKAFVNTVNPLAKDFKQTGLNVFCYAAENLDFSNGIKAAARINQWASDSTEGLIDDIVTPNMFNEDTRVAFFNALYFLGKWVLPFNVNKTEVKDFYLNDVDKISLPMMYQQSTFLYGESQDLDCQIIRLLYKGTFSLLIYLPREKTGLFDLTVKLNETGAFATSLGLLTRQPVKLSLPRIKIIADIKMNDMVKARAPALFSPSKDFRGIFEDDESLVVTDILQKCVLNVDEKGTEAAAVTGAIFGTTSIIIREVAEFVVNHPALLVLCMDDYPVFTAVYAGAK